MQHMWATALAFLWSHNDHRRSQISAADVSLLVTCWSVQKRIWALEMLQSKMWRIMMIRRCSKWLEQESTTHQSVSQTGVLFCEHRPREGGHFLCLRSIGLPAEEFAIGFGPQAGEPNAKKWPKRDEMMWNVSPFDFLSDHWSSFVTFSCFVLTLPCLVSLTLSWFWERLVPCFFVLASAFARGNSKIWDLGQMENASEGLVERCPQIKGSIFIVIFWTHIDCAIAQLYRECMYCIFHDNYDIYHIDVIACFR